MSASLLTKRTSLSVENDDDDDDDDNDNDEEVQGLVANSANATDGLSRRAYDDDADASRREGPSPNVARLWITTMSTFFALVAIMSFIFQGPVGAVYGMIIFVVSYHVYVWIRLQQGHMLNTHHPRPQHDGHRIKSVDFHPKHASWILMAMYSGKVALWKTDEEPQPQTFLVVSQHPVRIAKFLVSRRYNYNNDSNYNNKDDKVDDKIVTASDDMHVRILTLEGRLVHAWRAHDDYIRSVVIHFPYLVTSGDDMVIKVWDMEYNFALSHILGGHDHYVMQIKVNPSCVNSFDMLASASLDRTIKLWKLAPEGTTTSTTTSATTDNLQGTLEGHARGVNTIDFFPATKYEISSSPPSSSYTPYLISGADDCTVMVWNYQTQELLHTLRDCHVHNVNAVLFVSNVSFVSASEDGTCVLWNVQTFQPVQTMSHDMGYAWNLAHQDQEGSLVAIAYEEGCVCIHHTNSSTDTQLQPAREAFRWRSRDTKNGRLFLASTSNEDYS